MDTVEVKQLIKTTLTRRGDGKSVKVVKRGSKSQVLRAKILACGLDYEAEMDKILDQYN